MADRSKQKSFQFICANAANGSNEKKEKCSAKEKIHWKFEQWSILGEVKKIKLEILGRIEQKPKGDWKEAKATDLWRNIWN